VQPPFKPKIVSRNSLISINHFFNLIIITIQKHRKDVSNFDKQFTSEKTDLTPTDKVFMMNLDQSEFVGFSYMNPEYVFSP